jgi:hypothetical protein
MFEEWGIRGLTYQSGGLAFALNAGLAGRAFFREHPYFLSDLGQTLRKGFFGERYSYFH